MRSPLPEFWQLVIQTRESSEAVDVFDFDESKESVEEFERLCKESDKDALALVEFVLKNGEKLKKKFSFREVD